MMYYLIFIQVLLITVKLTGIAEISWIVTFAPFSILGLAVYLDYLVTTISNGTFITR